MFSLTIGLAVLLTLELLWLVACAAWEWPEAGAISFIITVAVADYFFSAGVVQWAWENPGLLVAAFAGYLALGTAWSFFKWLTFLKRTANEAKDQVSSLYKKFNLEGSLDEAIETLRSMEDGARVQEDSARNGSAQWPNPGSDDFRSAAWDLIQLKTPPQAADNKRRITSWIATWPFSGIWFLIDEPIKFIWDWFRSSYQRLSDRMWESVTSPQG